MKHNKLTAGMMALMMAAVLAAPALAEDDEEFLSCEEPAVQEIQEVMAEIAPAAEPEIIEVAAPAEEPVEVEIAESARETEASEAETTEAEATAPETAETEKETEVSETEAAETEGQAEPAHSAAETFTCKARIALANETETIAPGDQVTLMAVVTGANMAYTLRWESRAANASSDAPWKEEGEEETLTFIAGPETAALEYRFCAVGEDGTVVFAKVWRLGIGASTEDDALIETGEETLEEIIEEVIPEEEFLEIEEYETPLGLDMDTAQESTEGETPADEQESKAADGASAAVTSLPEGTEADGTDAEESENGMRVTISSSARTQMTLGEEVHLTSSIEGFDGYEVAYQWECDRHNGEGFQNVADANDDTYAFTATVETLSWDWRLTVYFD